MKRIYFILLAFLFFACDPEEIIRGEEFFGTYELDYFAIYDEYGENVLDFIYYDLLPARGELKLNPDGTYTITAGYENIISFLNGPYLRPNGELIEGIWEVTESFLYPAIHFDRGIFESLVEFEVTPNGIDFFEPYSRKIPSDMNFRLYDLGYDVGIRLAERANLEDNLTSGRDAGLLYGFYEGYYFNTELDEFGISDDLIYNFAEGFILGFESAFAGVSSTDFDNGFNETYFDNYDFGATVGLDKGAPSVRTFEYASEYSFTLK